MPPTSMPRPPSRIVEGSIAIERLVGDDSDAPGRSAHFCGVSDCFREEMVDLYICFLLSPFL